MRNLKKVLSITAAAAMAVSTVTPVSVFAESDDRINTAQADTIF